MSIKKKNLKIGDLVIPGHRASSYIRRYYRLGIVIELFTNISAAKIYWVIKGEMDVAKLSELKRINQTYER